MGYDHWEEDINWGRYYQYGSYEYTYYCTRSIENGKVCIFDDQCMSGLCINETETLSTCRPEGLDALETCSSDTHCKSYSCAYAEYASLEGQSTKCCAEGRSYYAQVPLSYNYARFCAGSTPVGGTCDSTQYGQYLCETGICIGGVCVTERLPNGEECEYANDCQNDCGYNSTDYWSREKLCCENVMSVYQGGYYQEICVGSLS